MWTGAIIAFLLIGTEFALLSFGVVALAALLTWQLSGPTTGTQTHPKFCGECGRQMPDTEKFCSECGTERWKTSATQK